MVKGADLFHRRVFDDKEWAESYFRRNQKAIARTGRRLAALLDRVGATSGRAVDLGCGFATVDVEVARSHPAIAITGIDLAKPLLDIGRRLIEEGGVAGRVTLQEGDVCSTGLADDCADIVISSYMVHIVEDPRAMLGEIERIGKPTATIVITDLRRMWMVRFEKKLRTALSFPEARSVVTESTLRAGRLTKGPFWWDYVASGTG